VSDCRAKLRTRVEELAVGELGDMGLAMDVVV
jgi:putative component of toxin-antitoxin plasmid stabilization module